MILFRAHCIHTVHPPGSTIDGNASEAFTKTEMILFNIVVIEDWMYAPSLTTDKPRELRQENSLPQAPIKNEQNIWTGSQIIQTPNNKEQILDFDITCWKKIKWNIADLSPLSVASFLANKKTKQFTCEVCL